MQHNSYQEVAVPYPQQPAMTTIVVSVETASVETIRGWIRTVILERELIPSVEDFLFRLYQDLGKK